MPLYSTTLMIISRIDFSNMGCLIHIRFQVAEETLMAGFRQRRNLKNLAINVREQYKTMFQYSGTLYLIVGTI